jgi:hypothetical protein
VWVESTHTSVEPGLGMQVSPGWPGVPKLMFMQYSSEPPKRQPSLGSAQVGMVVQHTWPGCPHASHCDTPPIATQVVPALHDVPQHGCRAAPHWEHIAPTHPPEELPLLLPEPEPPPRLLPDDEPPLLLPEVEPLLLLPEEVPPPLLLSDVDPPLLAPSVPASGVEVDVTSPPQPTSGRARRSPQVTRPRLRITLTVTSK